MFESNKKSDNFITVTNKILLKRLISHVKLLLGKIYIPKIMNLIFIV